MMVGRFGNGSENDEEVVGWRKRRERKKEKERRVYVWAKTGIYCTRTHPRSILPTKPWAIDTHHTQTTHTRISVGNTS